MNINNPKEISPNLRLEGNEWYMFYRGEAVRTPLGTGFVVGLLKPLNSQGLGCCYVQLDGHEDEEPTLFTCSTQNLDIDAISIE